MNEKKLIFKIKKDGKIEMDAIGFSGCECYHASEDFERLFEIENVENKYETDETTKEYYETESKETIEQKG